MNFDLTDDQAFFQETARKFLENECPITSTRALEDDPDGFDRTTWQRAAELGWTSLLAPESLGGGSFSGNAVADLAIVAEEIGRLVAPGPLVPVNVVIAALARSGSEPQQERVIPGLMTGQTIAAWAFAEGNDTWGVEGIRTTVHVDGDELVVSGTKRFVEVGASADYLLVTAMSDEGPTQILLDADTAGISITPGRSVDLVRRFADIRFDDVRVRADALVGEPGGAIDDIEYQRQVALALQVAETAGAIDQMYEATLEYLQDRWSFGRPLASYQALKHRVADMLLMVETAKGCAEAAADTVGTGDSDAPRSVAVAKAYVSRVSIEILSDCVQLHGGIGVTWEHDIHLYERRAAVNRAVYGTPEYHHEQLCVLVGEGAQ
jgi:alkylation response protein AidB-like acyl-CoA dehydrogenase